MLIVSTREQEYLTAKQHQAYFNSLGYYNHRISGYGHSFNVSKTGNNIIVGSGIGFVHGVMFENTDSISFAFDENMYFMIYIKYDNVTGALTHHSEVSYIDDIALPMSDDIIGRADGNAYFIVCKGFYTSGMNIESLRIFMEWAGEDTVSMIKNRFLKCDVSQEVSYINSEVLFEYKDSDYAYEDMDAALIDRTSFMHLNASGLDVPYITNRKVKAIDIEITVNLTFITDNTPFTLIFILGHLTDPRIEIPITPVAGRYSTTIKVTREVYQTVLPYKMYSTAMCDGYNDSCDLQATFTFTPKTID